MSREDGEIRWHIRGGMRQQGQRPMMVGEGGDRGFTGGWSGYFLFVWAFFIKGHFSHSNRGARM